MDNIALRSLQFSVILYRKTGNDNQFRKLIIISGLSRLVEIKTLVKGGKVHWLYSFLNVMFVFFTGILLTHAMILVAKTI